jgi:hypothetical protein
MIPLPMIFPHPKVEVTGKGEQAASLNELISALAPEKNYLETPMNP